MKTQRNIFIAFMLNLFFAIFELFGGIFTNSVAILSDAIHDLGDACSIGVAFFLEKLSKKKPNTTHTYGYTRYSVLGAAFTSIVLIFGSGMVFMHAIERLLNPVAINYNGMIVFGIIGVIVNFIAACFTKNGDSLNQKAVNIHMLEDALGWVIVLLGAVIIKFTNWNFIDPLLSMGLSVYIAFQAIKNMRNVIFIFSETNQLQKETQELGMWLKHIGGVKEIHHLHIWQLSENKFCATVHVVTSQPTDSIKKQIRYWFKKYGIEHVTIEFESETENCQEKMCNLYLDKIQHIKCGCHSHNSVKDNTASKQAVKLPKWEIEI